MAIIGGTNEYVQRALALRPPFTPDDVRTFHRAVAALLKPKKPSPEEAALVERLESGYPYWGEQGAIAALLAKADLNPAEQLLVQQGLKLMSYCPKPPDLPPPPPDVARRLAELGAAVSAAEARWQAAQEKLCRELEAVERQYHQILMKDSRAYGIPGPTANERLLEAQPELEARVREAKSEEEAASQALARARAKLAELQGWWERRAREKADEEWNKKFSR